MAQITLSFDIEEFDFPIERGKDIDFDTQMSVSSEGTEYILNALAAHQIKATFYVTANFAQHRPDLVKRMVADGHEVASHDFYHSLTATSQPAEARRALEEIAGTRVVGYRAPRLAAGSSESLAQAGFLYNSSMNPTWIPGRYNNLSLPRTHWHDGAITIYPTSVAFPVRVPLFWLALHVFPLWLYKAFAVTAMRHDGNLSLYFHPWEFSNRLKEPAFGIPAYISMVSGNSYRQRFEALIQWLKKGGNDFVTTSQYLHI